MTDGRIRSTRTSRSGLRAGVGARALAVTAVLAAGGALGLHAVGPAHADPKVDDARAKVESLYRQAEIASESYNAARLQLTDSKAKVASLKADAARQQRKVASMRQDVAGLLVGQYQGQGLSTASSVVFAPNQKRFIDNLSAATSYNSQQATVMDKYDQELRILQLRRAAAAEQVKALDQTEDVLRTEKQRIDTKAAEAKKVLGELEDKERLALALGMDPGKLPPVSGKAGIALKYALAQVGDSYVWGATGPNAFDCSGLMLAAWGQAGVGLPHSSRAQQGSGTPVAKSDLRPGDLVFYYSPVSHVGMYIGNGRIVNAENPSAGVTVTGLDSMPYSGAVRVG